MFLFEEIAQRFSSNIFNKVHSNVQMWKKVPRLLTISHLRDYPPQESGSWVNLLPRTFFSEKALPAPDWIYFSTILSLRHASSHTTMRERGRMRASIKTTDGIVTLPEVRSPVRKRAHKTNEKSRVKDSINLMLQFGRAKFLKERSWNEKLVSSESTSTSNLSSRTNEADHKIASS